MFNVECCNLIIHLTTYTLKKSAEGNIQRIMKIKPRRVVDIKLLTVPMRHRYYPVMYKQEGRFINRLEIDIPLEKNRLAMNSGFQVILS